MKLSLRPLSEFSSQAYLSNGSQVADVMEWILDQVGVSDVIQTSFSISEEFLRRVFFLKAKGNIRRMSLLLDLKATNKTAKLWHFMSNVYDEVFLTSNHSKILLISPLPKSGGVKHPDIVVVTSQNLTRGNRYESAVITTEPHICSELHSRIDYITENLSVPLNELLQETD